MRASLRVVVPALAAAHLAACFDFDATMAGHALVDGGPASDATSGPDATASDAFPFEAQAGSYCASIAPDGGLFFCDDFDEHPLPGSWQQLGETSGTLTETDASSLSPPDSLDEKTFALDGGQVINVALRTPLGLPALPATVRFGFGLQPVQIDPAANAGIVLGAVDFLDAAGDRYTVGLSIDVVSGKPALLLVEQTATTDGGIAYAQHPLDPLQPLPMNAWTDLVIEIDWSAPTSAQAKVLVGGSVQLTVPLTMTVTAASLQIGVGTSYESQPSPGWELRYDDVRFTAR